MKVERINHYREGFIAYLLDQKSEFSLAKYQVLQEWSRHWNVEEVDLASMFDKSLTSTISGHIWGGSTDSMKSEMLRMITQNKEYVRSSYRNLMEDHKDLGLRIDRFLHHLDELYRYIKTNDHKAVSHYHTRSTSMLYLALTFPHNYCLHDYPTFEAAMTRLESRAIPQEMEIERYYKSLRGIYKLLTKDPVLEQALAVRCAAQGVTYQSSMLVINDYMAWVASH